MSSNYDADGVQFRFNMPADSSRRALVAEVEIDDDPKSTTTQSSPCTPSTRPATGTRRHT